MKTGFFNDDEMEFFGFSKNKNFGFGFDDDDNFFKGSFGNGG